MIGWECIGKGGLGHPFFIWLKMMEKSIKYVIIIKKERLIWKEEMLYHS